MAEKIILTPQEVIEKIDAFSKTDAGKDGFRIKVKRRKANPTSMFPNAPNEQIATVVGATSHHCVNAEEWLSAFSGGGNYTLSIYPMVDTIRPIGDLEFKVTGQPTDPDYGIFVRIGWNGPPGLEFPRPEDVNKRPPPQTVISPGVIPSTSPQASTTPPNVVPNAAVSGGPSDAWAARLESMGAQLEAQRREAEALRLQLQRAEAERERERDRAQQAAEMQALKAQMDRLATIAAAPPPQAPKTDISHVIASLTTAISPILTAMLANGNEMRKLLAEQQAQANRMTQDFLLKSMDRPAISPEVAAMQERFDRLIEKLRDGDGSSTVLTQVADAMGGMMSTVTTVIQNMAQLNNGQAEPNGVIVIREIGKAVEAFAKAAASTAKPKRVASRVTNGVGAVATQPLQTPISQQPPIAHRAEPANVVDFQKKSTLARIEQMIRNKADPATVAAEFVHAVQTDQAFNTVIQESGSLADLFQDRLGEWAVQNFEYVGVLFEEVQKHLAAAGIVLETSDDDGVETVEAEATVEESE